MNRAREGFTLIETLVTIVVAAIFIVTMFAVYLSVTNLTRATSEYNIADQLAYNNLRTYAYGMPPKWFTCDIDSKTGKAKPVILLSNPPTHKDSLVGPVDGIKGSVKQTLVATAPYGCGGGSVGMGYPLLVVSTVTYGNDRTVSHATYVSY